MVCSTVPPYFQAGLGFRIFTEPAEPMGRTWTNLPFCHWKMNVVAAALRPSESNLTGPCTVCSVTPLCRYEMLDRLLRHLPDRVGLRDVGVNVRRRAVVDLDVLGDHLLALRIR